MQDRELYATILGIQRPWRVHDVHVRVEGGEGEVEVFIEHDGSPIACPTCELAAPRYDARSRSWRHLDTCQYRTILTAAVPRAKCPKHGVHQILVPWSEPGGRFTALFERLAISWLLEASTAAVTRRLRVSWDELDGIMQRAIKRGLARRKVEPLTHLGVDETSFQKRHEYVTVVTDLVRSRVVEVADNHDEEGLKGFYSKLSKRQLSSIRAVAMDMWRPYVKATRDHVPDAELKIAFDRFHVAKHLNGAVNDVRKREHRELLAEGDDRLLRTKYLWLMGGERRKRLPRERRIQFAELRKCSLKVARAWAMKETARELWSYETRAGAERGWKKWIGWVLRSRLEPMRRSARMVKDHLWGILNAIVLRVTNATSESLNARIQWLKKAACGFRNRARFRAAILFHCGGLDLYPRPTAHTKV
jgi:transposase